MKKPLDKNLTDALVTSDEFDSFDYNLRQEIEELGKIDYDSQSDSWKENTIASTYLLTAEKLLREAGLLDGFADTIGELKKEITEYRSARVLLQTLRLAIITARAGIIPEMAHYGEGFRKRQSKVASRHRTTGGLTPEERQGRNEEIIARFETASKNGRITPNGFATKYAKNGFTTEDGKTHKLSPTQIKNIIKPTD